MQELQEMMESLNDLHDWRISRIAISYGEDSGILGYHGSVEFSFDYQDKEFDLVIINFHDIESISFNELMSNSGEIQGIRVEKIEGERGSIVDCHTGERYIVFGMGEINAIKKS